MRSRLPARGQAGFTLVELLIVMLILGVLAAIALPAFFNQRRKAHDAKAKTFVHSSEMAMEVYASDNNGSYVAASVARLRAIEPTLSGATLALSGVAARTYTISVTAPVTSNRYRAIRAATGAISYTCTTAGTGGCPTGGVWGR